MATSCIKWVDENDNNGNGNNGNGNGSNNLKKGQIIIKVYPDSGNEVLFGAITTKITIDWGDGVVDKLTPNGVVQEFTHTFANKNLQTIKIESEKLVGFGVGDDYTFKELYFGEMNELERLFCSSSLTVLEIKKANSLKILNCRGNELTSLDIKHLTALEALDCSWNGLTSLDVRGLNNIKSINCNFNQLSSNVLNSLFDALPSLSSSKPPYWDDDYYLYEDNYPYGWVGVFANPGYEGCNKAIAENKGWKLFY